MHVPDEVAEVIKRNITRSISKHPSARTYHMEVNVDHSVFLESSRNATFPISWLRSVNFELEMNHVTQRTLNWFQNHRFDLLVNKHGQNLSCSGQELETTLNWLNPGKRQHIFFIHLIHNVLFQIIH